MINAFKQVNVNKIGEALFDFNLKRALYRVVDMVYEVIADLYMAWVGLCSGAYLAVTWEGNYLRLLGGLAGPFLMLSVFGAVRRVVRALVDELEPTIVPADEAELLKRVDAIIASYDWSIAVLDRIKKDLEKLT